MKLAIIGGRDFTDKFKLFREVKELMQEYPEINTIVSGGAQGADSYGEQFALENKIHCIIFQAKWDDLVTKPYNIRYNKFGKPYNALAGFVRNTQIIKESDIVIAYWDGKSPGTKDSLDKAKSLGKIIIIKKY